MKETNNRSTPGTDEVNYKTLKLFNKTAPHILAELYSSCLEHGVFPAVWKAGKVVWIPKPDKSLTNHSGYRPITLLSTLGKVLERVIVKRVNEHLDANRIISPRQYGFRRHRGTENAVKRLLNDIDLARDLHNYVLVISLDVRAAFDTVKWSHIRREARKCGLPSYLRRIIDNYLSERKVSSGRDTLPMRSGCPQGSVLGPTIWNLAYNYIVKDQESKGINAVCYADDTALILSDNNLARLTASAEETILHIETKLAESGLLLNIEKTQTMLLYGNKLQKYNPDLIEMKIRDNPIKSTATLKYLGLLLDHHQDWRPHIVYLINKTKKKLPGILNVCKNTYGYSQKARITMIQATIGAYFRYGSAFFAHRLPACRNEINSLHRMIVIACGRLYRTVSYFPATAITGIMPLILESTLAAIKRTKHLGWTPPIPTVG